MSLFICTAGTSIAEGGPLRRGESLEAFRARIESKIASAQSAADGDPIRMLTRLCAETNGLARADCGPHDQVSILASDTPDGLASAEAVAKVVADMLGPVARVRGVKGLQVSEAGSFRQSGIRNLIDIVLREVQTARIGGIDPIVFNVTGGFKGVVPYLTVLGMLNDIETIYVYDFSEILIRLPPLPLRFDRERIAFALPALRLLQNAETLEEETFRRLLPGRGWHDDPVVKDLIETVEGLVALSAAGELALRGMATERKTYAVRLHRNAQRSPMLDHQKTALALRDMRVPESFLIQTHSWDIPHCTDFKIWKARGPAAPRLFYWIEDDNVMVAEILHHEVYDNDLIHGSRRIWKQDYSAADFVPHVAATLPSDPLAQALSDWVAELEDEHTEHEQRLAQLEREGKELQERIADDNRRRGRLEEQLATAERELAAVRADRDRLAGRLAGEPRTGEDGA
jgi:putative CRISPR-associated protein (TIGR02619 family)